MPRFLTMTLSGLFVFSTVYALAVATPGPGVAAVLARSLARGAQGAPAFIAGFLIGDLVWFTFAATGLAAIAARAQPLFLVLKYVGAAYLLYLAWRLWSAPARPLEEHSASLPQQTPVQVFLSSLVLTLGNPKTMVFFLALLPTVVHLETLDLTDRSSRSTRTSGSRRWSTTRRRRRPSGTAPATVDASSASGRPVRVEGRRGEVLLRVSGARAAQQLACRVGGRLLERLRGAQHGPHGRGGILRELAEEESPVGSGGLTGSLTVGPAGTRAAAPHRLSTG